jgi:hypothetical protein
MHECRLRLRHCRSVDVLLSVVVDRILKYAVCERTLHYFTRSKALELISHICWTVKCPGFVGHTYMAHVMLYDHVMGRYTRGQALRPKQLVTTQPSPPGFCTVSNNQAGHASLFMCMASILVVFTCTPDSIGTHDMELFDIDVVNMILGHYGLNSQQYAPHVIYCRDTICMLMDYDFSFVKAPIMQYNL